MHSITIIRDRALTEEEPLLGNIYIDGLHIGVTLEKRSRSIEPGLYRAKVAHSNKFQRDVVRLMNTSPRTDILIHPGNSIADTEGCILVGEVRRGAQILNSGITLNRLLNLISAKNDILVSISDIH